MKYVLSKSLISSISNVIEYLYVINIFLCNTKTRVLKEV